MSQATFYWHDYETFGAQPAVDRPVQFAGIRTDWELNEIPGSELNIFCKPSDDYLPQPEACLITGITPQDALRDGVCEAAFIGRIHAEFATANTCAVGYNNLRFDDEVTRFTLYRNFFDPYGREWQNGNSRWDIIDVLRMARALRPEGIVWPCYEDGRPSLRLEDLSQANHLEHSSAHDALSDVRATIAMARLLKQSQPRLFDYALNLRDKRQVSGMFDLVRMKPLLHISSRFSIDHLNCALVAPLAQHPVNRNAVIVYDLSVDPSPLLNLPVEAICQRLYTPREQLPAGVERIPLKQVHSNRSPMLAPAKMLDAAQAERLGISGDLCRRHLQALRTQPGLAQKVAEVFASSDLPVESDPDRMLYSGGFFAPADRATMDRLRTLSPEQLAQEGFAFQDGRLEEMLFRYRARNYPDSLSADEHEQWEQFRRQRLLGEPQRGALNYASFAEALNRLAEQHADQPGKLGLLQDLAAWAEAIYPA